MRYQWFSWLTVLSFGVPLSVAAQIVPDATLQNPSIATPNGTTTVITGGTTGSNNLFHSFSQFSIPTGEAASFQHTANITNLLVRVTGNSASSIDGLLQTELIGGTGQSQANFFLLNPNGILFGANAQLNLGGSFVATTADSIRLSNGSEFSARQPTEPLLTIAVPIGLQFGNRPGKIEHQANVFGLQLLDGKNLALIGGRVELSGGVISASDSSVELAAIDTGLVTIEPNTLTFDYRNVTAYEDMSFSNGSLIQVRDTTNSRINLTGRNITAADSQIASGNLADFGTGADIRVRSQNLSLSRAGFFTLTQGAGQGGSLIVNVDDAVELDGEFTGLLVNRFGSGKTGDLTITARTLSLTNGAQINGISGEESSGDSGNLNLQIRDRIVLSGFAVDPFDTTIGLPSTISTETRGAGNAGRINLSTQRLEILGGAQIIASTAQGGRAGDIDIQAQDIKLIGVGQFADGQLVNSGLGGQLSSTISSDARPNSTGRGANLNIVSDQLTLRDGAAIQAATFGAGDAGDISITATRSIFVGGRTPNPQRNFPSSILAVSGGLPNQTFEQISEATGKGGNVVINTPELRLVDGAQIAIGSLNNTPAARGAGDRLQINADIISLDRAQLSSQTEAGNGGTFDITANRLLLLRNGSRITTQAGGNNQSGNAGDIRITTPLIIARFSENSDINANAAKGNGGNVFITADSIVGIEPRFRLTNLSDITASSDSGVQGTITLNSPLIDPDRGTVALPTTPNDPSNQIDQSCSPSNTASSQFTIVGRGGLPANPQTTSVTTVPRLATVPKSPTSVSSGETSIVIREAQGMQRMANGRIRFVVSDRESAMRWNDPCR